MEKQIDSKQVEQMARIICGNKRDCRDCGHNRAERECGGLLFAKRIYEQGYRKQIEGEWVTKHRHRGGFRTVTVVDSLGEKHTGIVDDRWECDDLYCSVCGKIAHDAFLNYCANCGAKMKGGAE